MFTDLATIPLQDLPTNFLCILRDDIKRELFARRKTEKVRRRLGTLKTLVYKDHDFEDILNIIGQENKRLLLAIPSDARMQAASGGRRKYLPFLLSQAWNHLFPSASVIGNHSYVYAHVDPRKKESILTGLHKLLPGEPFYIGKGMGRRAWDLKRNQGHGKRIKQILNEGFPSDSLVQIIKEGLNDRDAFVLEAKLIYFFGSIYDESCMGTLFNLVDHIRPEFSTEMRTLPAKHMCKRESV